MVTKEGLTRRSFLVGTGLVAVAPTILIPSRAEAAPRALKKREDLYELPEDDLFARMLYGEARGISSPERITIGFTPLNRIDNKKFKSDKDLVGTLLRDRQYSCFNEDDDNFEKVLNPLKYESLEVWKKCFDCARNHLNNEYEGWNFRQTNYHTKEMEKKPYWAKNMSTKLPSSPAFKHEFYIA